MKNKNTLVNVLIFATATHFLKKWLLDEDQEKAKVKKVEDKGTLKRKKEQLVGLFS